MVRYSKKTVQSRSLDAWRVMVERVMALRMVQVTRVRTHGIGLASIAREHSIGIFMGSRGFLLKSGVFFPQTYSPYSDLFARYSRRLAYSQGELIPNAIHFNSSFYSCYSLVAE